MSKATYKDGVIWKPVPSKITPPWTPKEPDMVDTINNFLYPEITIYGSRTKGMLFHLKQLAECCNMCSIGKKLIKIDKTQYKPSVPSNFKFSKIMVVAWGASEASLNAGHIVFEHIPDNYYSTAIKKCYGLDEPCKFGNLMFQMELEIVNPKVVAIADCEAYKFITGNDDFEAQLGKIVNKKYLVIKDEIKFAGLLERLHCRLNNI